MWTGTLSALGVSCRAQTTGSRNSSSSSSGGGGGDGLSLSDLAKAFQQMGTAATTGLEDGVTDSGTVTATSASSAHGDSRSRIQNDRHRHAGAPLSSSSSLPTHDIPQVDQQEGKGNSGVLDKSAAPVSREKAPSRTHNAAAAAAASDFIHFSIGYSDHLRSLTATQLCAEIETQLGRRDPACVLQCLYEVAVNRLSAQDDVSPAARIGVTARTARELAKDDGRHEQLPQCRSEAHLVIQRNHRMLTAVLRLMTLVDVYAMESAMEAWLRANKRLGPPHDPNFSTQCHHQTPDRTAAARPTTTNTTTIDTDDVKKRVDDDGGPNVCSKAHSPLSYPLARRVLQWLSCEVAGMDAHTSLKVLHLLAQQNLTWSEAVLATLVDTIEVHIARGSRAAQAFTLEQYSLLLDTMARFQAQQLNVVRLQQLFSRASASPADEAASAEEASLNTYSSTVGRRAVVDSCHPVANAHFFNTIAEALTRELTGTNERDDDATTGAAAAAASAGALLRVRGATVFFLTRALSKLLWWNDALVSALTPGLTRYLQLHAESYAGVVMLVGRHENKSGDAALLYVLQTSLLELLSRRRVGERGHQSASVQSHHRSHNGDHDSDSDNDNGDLFLSDLAMKMEGEEEQQQQQQQQEEEQQQSLWWENRSAEPSSGLFEQEDDDAAVTAMGKKSRCDEDVELFSRLQRDHAVSSARSFPRHEASRQDATKQQGLPREEDRSVSASQSLSLIDLHSFPTFLESLMCFFSRTVQFMPSSACVPLPQGRSPAPDLVVGSSSQQQQKEEEEEEQEQQRRSASTDTQVTAIHVSTDVLQAQMRVLFSYLQDDLQRSIASLEAFAKTASGSLQSQLLLTVISAAAQLQSLQGAEQQTSLGDRARSVSASSSSSSLDSVFFSPLLVELTYAWTLHVAQQRPPPLPPRDGRASQSPAAVAHFHRIAASARWRRVLRVHRALVRAGLLVRTRSSFDSSTATAATADKFSLNGHRPPAHANNNNNSDGEGVLGAMGGYVCEPGRYFMPDAVVEAAPRVHAAVTAAKTRLQAERRRRCTKMEASLRSGRAEGQLNRQCRRAPAPRFASASLRATPPPCTVDAAAAEDQRRRDAVAALRRPVCSSDVFAKYSKAVSRLL